MKKTLKVFSVLILLLLLVSCSKDPILDDENNPPKVDEVTYVVTFDTSNGTKINSLTINEGDDINISSVKTPKKEHHTFLYWSYSLSDISEVSGNIKITKDIKLYAIYDLNKYEVAIDPSNGEEVNKVAVSYDNDFNIETLLSPKKEHHTFLYWSYSLSDISEVSGNIKITKDIKLYAIYEVNSYTITIKDNYNNTFENISTLYNTKPKYTYELPSLKGYTYKFSGYSLNKDGSNLLSQLPNATSNETYFIIFEKNIIKYDVLIDALNEENPKTLKINYNEQLNEPKKPKKKVMCLLHGLMI